MKFPPWWGYGYFLEPHNVCMFQKTQITKCLVLYCHQVLKGHGDNMKQTLKTERDKVDQNDELQS